METTLLEKTPLAMLEEYARTAEKRRFAAVADTVDWAQYRPAELIRVIDLALSLELVTLAIKLAQQGRRLFPQDEQVQQAAQVLAPPVVREIESRPPDTLNISIDWLRHHANQYREQWVAVRDGKLLGAAPTLKKLAEITTLDEKTVVTKVL
jgi:hypothetical protein